MKATIVKFLSNDKQVRILVLDNTAMLQQIFHKQPLKGVYGEALATFFTMSSLLCGILKDGQRLSIRLKTSTPDEYFHCDVESNGDVRGYASDAIASRISPAAQLPELIGDKGLIRMAKDLGMGAMFTSTVDMPYRNIVDDFGHFFKQSEQLETRFRYFYHEQSAQVHYSRAVLIQALPFAHADAIQYWVQEIAEKKNLFQTTGAAFAHNPSALFQEAKLIEQRDIRLYCSCSRDTLLPLLYSLGMDELRSLADARQSVDISCNSCGQAYTYSHSDLAQLLG